jgi:t-SNARE complex subunit (syntaxin)
VDPRRSRRAGAQVNEAFKDLSAIVDEQGHSIEQIEVNIGEAHASTEKGVGFLQVREGRKTGRQGAASS